MWPFRSSRSSTLLMSKLGYLASRAPKAMFSKSRKTAMVASDVVVGMDFCPGAPREPRLEPIVVEADAHALRTYGIRCHFVPQPAFEQDQFAGLGGHGHPGPVRGACARFARRRGHEPIEARILEFQP